MANSVPFNQFLFQPVELLGAGGLGSVDKIRVTASNAPRMPVGSEWARKRLNAQWNQHPTMRERFEREISALRRMSHPSIVTCEGENLPGGERFYLMPLFTSSVRKWIAGGNNRGDWKLIAALGAGLADAMQYAHDQGFIHRDLKPDNILFNGGGPLVIADWGLGYFVHKESKVLQQLTRGGMGTEYYCSLEQWSSGKCDGRGDIYSLGMTLDEMVTGSQRAIVVGMGLTGTAPPGTSPGARSFQEVLQAMTAPFAAQRFATMRDVATSLRAAAAAG